MEIVKSHACQAVKAQQSNNEKVVHGLAENQKKLHFAELFCESDDQQTHQIE